MPRDPRVDAYIAEAAPFARPILRRLRKLIHAGCPRVEEGIRWNMPAFLHHGLLVGIAAFKGHVALAFWKHGLLVKEGTAPEAVRTAMGQFGCIRSLSDLPAERTLVLLVRRAAALNEQGIRSPRRVKPRPALPTPAWFTAALEKKPRALAAFRAFPPSHRREYVEWVTEAKTQETRQRRVATAVEWIGAGKPRQWKYQKSR